jgi:hypothetical protein
MALSETTRTRLDVQGLSDISDEVLASTAPWHRMAFFLCAMLAGAGTFLASPTILLSLTAVSAPAAILPFHPFDLIYNYGVRHLRNTGPLPRRRAQARFACGVATVWLVATALAFGAGMTVLGYILGGLLTGVGMLVGTTDICIPSMIYNALFLRSKGN